MSSGGASPIRAGKARGELLLARIRGLQEGPTREALVGEEGPVAAGPPAPAFATSDEAAALNEQMARRISDLRIQGIEDEHARAIASVNERYDHELAKAMDLNANIEEVERAHQSELELLETKRLRNVAQEQERLFKERQAATLSLGEEIRRLEIETGGGTDLQKGMQLLGLEREEALAEAAASGVDPDMVKRLFDLKAQQLEAGQMEERIPTRGTFSAEAAQLLGGGRAGPEEETAKNTKALVEGVIGLRRDVRRGQLLWGT